jgi:hypothetical protein
MFNMRPSIPVSQDASKQLRLLHKVHAMVSSVLHVHNNYEMQARSEPSTAPQFVKGDTETRCQLLQETSSYVGSQIGS